VGFSELFIRNSVGTTLLTIALALAGIAAFRSLPVAPLPAVDFPTIQVQAQLPGASPETMASSVATPLERQFGHIASLTEMTSTSTLGQTAIVLQFDLSRNIDAAGRDVQAAINAARSYLPSNLPSQPNYRKVNPADPPIMILALTSQVKSPGQLYDAADSVLEQKLSQIEGVGQVIVGGGALPAVRVELNPTQLKAFGISLEQVRATLSSANANLPKGQIQDATHAWTIGATDQLLAADQYKPLIVGYHDGAAVRLSDVAEVRDSVQNLRASGYSDTHRAILVLIWRQPGANVIDTVDRVYQALPALRASIPASINLDVVLDRSTSIRSSVNDVELTLVISICLVVMVVFLFLRELRITAIPGLVVPISLVSTFGVMYLCGFSIDNLSLMALTIATGFVVDDAIVVVENISRYLEQGYSRYQAAILGAREIGFTVVSISISLIAVFIPILMMGGIVGRLFREFAVTLAAAVFVSMVISLTTTPMMCAKLLGNPKDQAHGRFYQLSETLFRRMLAGYERGLRWVINHSFLTLAVTVFTVALNIYLFYIAPKGFFPEQDNGRLAGAIVADQDTSYQAMNRRLVRLIQVVRADPAVYNVLAFTGTNGATNTANMFVGLKPLSERKLSAPLVIARIRKAVSGQAGLSLYLQATQDLRIGGRASNAEYQYTLTSTDLHELMEWAPKLLDKLRTIHLLTDVSSDQQNAGLAANIVIDRDSAARLGLSSQLIDDTLYDAYGQREVSTMYTPLNQYFVVMEVAPAFWQDPQSLSRINFSSTPTGGGATVTPTPATSAAANTIVEGATPVPPPSAATVIGNAAETQAGAPGGMTPLFATSRWNESTTALAVNHQGQFPAVTISFNLAPGASLGDVVALINNAERGLHMPATIRGAFAGTAQAFQASLANEPFLITAALLSVYIVLGILYESYIHPLTILSTLPSAGIGALLALRLCGIDLNVIALVGIILLIGIVKKNAILMIDFALDAERRQGKTPEEAIFQACLLRFRPIMMTTLAALLGGLPLAVGTGMGSELRRPLGIAIVGGLIVSQALTLFTTPIVYLYLDRLRLRILGRTREVAPRVAPVTTTIGTLET